MRVIPLDSGAEVSGVLVRAQSRHPMEELLGCGDDETYWLGIEPTVNETNAYDDFRRRKLVLLPKYLFIVGSRFVMELHCWSYAGYRPSTHIQGCT